MKLAPGTCLGNYEIFFKRCFRFSCICLIELFASLILLAGFSATVSGDCTPPAYSLHWGGPGTGQGQFFHITFIASGLSGDIYIADSHNNRIQRFTSNGQFLQTWGSYGSAPGQFSGPRGIAVDAAGIVYVVDTGNHRIQKFTADGTYLETWGRYGSGNGEFNAPFGICVSAAGDVYVTESQSHRIQRFTASGAFLAGWGSLGSADGEFDFPSGVATNDDGHVLVVDTDNDRIQVFKENGSFVSKWGGTGTAPAQFRFPHAILVNSDGCVYVTDSYNDRVQIFDAAGNYLDEWSTFGSGDGFAIPKGLTQFHNDIFVSDMLNYRIIKFDFPVSSVSPKPDARPGLTAQPNPSRSSGPLQFFITGGDFSGAQLVISDAQGRLIRNLYPKSALSAVWDGRNNSGVMCGPGFYIARSIVNDRLKGGVKIIRIP